MRVTVQPFVLLALGFVAAQEVAGNSARGLQQADVGKDLRGRVLQGVEANVVEARGNKKSSNSKTAGHLTVHTTATSHVEPTIISHTTSTTSAKSSSATSKSSSTSSTSTKATSTSTGLEATSTSISTTATSGSTLSASSATSSSRASSTAATSSTISSSASSSTASITSASAQTSTGTETGTATTSTSTAIQTPSRKWCDNSGSCSASSCEAPIKQGSNSTSSANRRSYPVPISKRAFIDPVTNWDALDDLPDTSDLSKYTASHFMDFGADPAAIFIDGLIGCTAIGVFSKQGMQGIHLWESPDYNKKTGVLNRDPVDTLWPAKDQAFVKQTLAKASAELSVNKAKFAGGELVIMLPKQGSDYLYEVDKTYKWSDKTASGRASTSKYGRMDLEGGLHPQGQGVVDMIKAMAKEATGITTVKECTYVPAEHDLTAGRFVVQYDPKSTGNKKAVQVWCEKTTQYPGSYAW